MEHRRVGEHRRTVERRARCSSCNTTTSALAAIESAVVAGAEDLSSSRTSLRGWSGRWPTRIWRSPWLWCAPAPGSARSDSTCTGRGTSLTRCSSIRARPLVVAPRGIRGCPWIWPWRPCCEWPTSSTRRTMPSADLAESGAPQRVTSRDRARRRSGPSQLAGCIGSRPTPLLERSSTTGS